MAKQFKAVLVIVLLVLTVLICFGFAKYLQYKNSRLFANSSLEMAVRKELNIYGRDITPDDCAGITELDLSYADFTRTLEGLEYFVNLEKLKCSAGIVSDISALSGLTKLKELKIPKNRISDLKPLSGLTSLEKLDLYDNRISNIEPLATLNKLRDLQIGKNDVIDFSPLSHLYGLHINDGDTDLWIREENYPSHLT